MPAIRRKGSRDTDGPENIDPFFSYELIESLERSQIKAPALHAIKHKHSIAQFLHSSAISPPSFDAQILTLNRSGHTLDHFQKHIFDAAKQAAS